MKIDPKKFYWFRQMSDGTIRPLKYVPEYKCFVSTTGLFPEERPPTGFADPKDAIEKMKNDLEYFGRVRINNPDPNIYAVLDELSDVYARQYRNGSGWIRGAAAKHLLVNGRKATEYLVRLKIEDSNR